MNKLHRHSALVLLAAFVVGGLIAPVLHEMDHVEQWRQSRAEHRGAGHHHHAAADDHDSEALPPCPDPVSVDLTCILCSGTRSLACGSTKVVVRSSASDAFSEASATTFAYVPQGHNLVRGPPKQVV